MKINTSFYLAKQGVSNISRNKQFSLASVGTIATCIFLIGLFYMIIANFTYILHNAEEKLNITIFFDEGTTQEQIDAIGDTQPLANANGLGALARTGRAEKNHIHAAHLTLKKRISPGNPCGDA